MRQNQPPSVLAIAILSLIAGLLGSCGNLAAVSWPFAEFFLENAFGEDASSGIDFGKRWPELAQWALAVLSLVPSFLLIVAGVGLLRLRVWGRYLTLVCASIAIVISIASLALFYYDLTASHDDLAQEMGPEGAVAITSASVIFGTLFDVLAIVYGIAALAVLLRPSNAAVFRKDRACLKPAV